MHLICVVTILISLTLHSSNTSQSFYPDSCEKALAFFGVTRADFETELNDAVFWSTSCNYTTHPLVPCFACDDCPKPPKCNRKTAQQWATANGKKTVEQTKGGLILQRYLTFSNDPEEQRKIISPVDPSRYMWINNTVSQIYWDCAALEFSKGAKGEINNFGQDAVVVGFGGSVPRWWKFELDNLSNDDQISGVVFRYWDGDVVGMDGSIRRCKNDTNAKIYSVTNILNMWESCNPKVPECKLPNYSISDPVDSSC